VSGALEGIASALRAEGGLLAAALRPEPAGATPHGDRVALGPRAEGRPEELALVVEAVREGYLLHYGEPRVLAADGDPDLALLAGDRLYALGLAKLADAGDLDSVAELADVIALAAVAHAADDPGLAEAVWSAGVAAVGWGPAPALADAKAAVRTQDPSARAALLAVARQIAPVVAPKS